MTRTRRPLVPLLLTGLLAAGLAAPPAATARPGPVRYARPPSPLVAPGAGHATTRARPAGRDRARATAALRRWAAVDTPPA
ncbi:hypothetical protein [Streptomyces sp. NPDC048196]|uniref:hypothetical protein n=1 Tax=Streptomyces sp. NPDC048196 TaxID=3154712 RepID=UPI0033E23403